MLPRRVRRLAVRAATSASVAAGAFLCVVLLLAALPAADGAFSGGAASQGNTFTAATVRLGSNDTSPAGSLLAMTDGRPADAPVVGCIRVTYTGNIPAQVRMYATVTGTGLAAYLDLTIERGALPAVTLPDCGGFTPDNATYAAANGVVYSGTLSGFATAHGTYADGLRDPTAASPATWTSGTTVAYRFTADLQNTTAAQGLTAAPTFWWEARG
jgi:hypothetical protein